MKMNVVKNVVVSNVEVVWVIVNVFRIWSRSTDANTYPLMQLLNQDRYIFYRQQFVMFVCIFIKFKILNDIPFKKNIKRLPKASISHTVMFWPNMKIWMDSDSLCPINATSVGVLSNIWYNLQLRKSDVINSIWLPFDSVKR